MRKTLLIATTALVVPLGACAYPGDGYSTYGNSPSYGTYYGGSGLGYGNGWSNYHQGNWDNGEGGEKGDGHHNDDGGQEGGENGNWHDNENGNDDGNESGNWHNNEEGGHEANENDGNWHNNDKGESNEWGNERGSKEFGANERGQSSNERVREGNTQRSFEEMSGDQSSE